MTPAKRVAHMSAKGYNLGFNFMPHDAAAKEKSGKNYAQQMDEAGLTGIKIIPRCHTIWPGVNKLAELFPRMIFHKTKCAYLIESLENYRRKVDKDGSVTDKIHEDWATHSSDSARMIGEAMLNNMLKGHAEVIRQTRESAPAQKPSLSSFRRYR